MLWSLPSVEIYRGRAGTREALGLDDNDIMAFSGPATPKLLLLAGGESARAEVADPVNDRYPTLAFFDERYFGDLHATITYEPALARKLLAHYEATPLHMDMRAVLDKIAESLEGDISIEPDWLSEHVGVLPEDRVRIDPEVWAQVAGHIERREAMRADYQSFKKTPESRFPKKARTRSALTVIKKSRKK